MRRTKGAAGGFALALTLALLPGTAPALECDGALDHTVTAVTVHAAPPTFSTGKGWTLAPQVETLGPSAEVCVRERRIVGFIGSRREWARIEFKSRKGGPTEGWISTRALKSGSRAELAPPLERMVLRWVGVAEAQPLDGGADDAPTSTPLLAGVFLAMLLGMAVKGLFDHLGAGIDARTYFLDTAKAFLVSPIVFAGFATGGDFSFTSQLGLVVYICMAFQNGFFWQTVLTKAGGPPGEAPARSASAPPAAA